MPRHPPTTLPYLSQGYTSKKQKIYSIIPILYYLYREFSIAFLDISWSVLLNAAESC